MLYVITFCLRLDVVCDLCFARVKPRVTLCGGVSCATLDIQVAHEGSGYVERACRGVELDRTRHDVVCGVRHLANF